MMKRLGRALGSAALDLSTGGIGSLAMQVGRDAAATSEKRHLAHPQETAFVSAVEDLKRTRGAERTCYLLTVALHDLMDR